MVSSAEKVTEGFLQIFKDAGLGIDIQTYTEGKVTHVTLIRVKSKFYTKISYRSDENINSVAERWQDTFNIWSKEFPGRF